MIFYNIPEYEYYSLLVHKPTILQKNGGQFRSQWAYSVQFYVTLNSKKTKNQNQIPKPQNQNLGAMLGVITSEQTSECHMSTKNKIRNNADLEVGLFCSARNPHHHNQHPSFYNASANIEFKSLPRQAQTGTTVVVRAISKQRIGQTVEEFRRENEQQILSDIIKYETELGRRPEWFDLLGRFSRLELKVVEQDLRWIYPHLFKQVDYKLAVGSPKMVMRQ